MGTRRDVMLADDERDAFLAGCVQLSTTPSTLTASQVNDILRPQVPGWQMRGDGSVVLSRWDLFVLWHYVTMSLATGGRGSNRAHGGPVFLPWHRMFLIRLEAALQEVTGDPDFGLPYWDWARDRQLSSQLWRAERLGANRGAVTTGALGALRVRITGRTSPATGGFLEAHQPRPITRAAATDPRSNQLPRKSAVAACLQQRAYDEDPWDVDAAGFRNEVEGWRPSPPGLHNLVHVWIGGDMAPGTSPNDPVFYLNHCNVDRTWEAWMVRFARRTYVPDGTPQNGDSPGHNLDEPMVALLGASLTPAEVLDPSPWYEYDSLLVEQ